jgi:hypothetical protein
VREREAAMTDDVLDHVPPTGHDSTRKTSVILIILGIVLFVAFVFLRYHFGGKFDVKGPELVLLVLPAVLWFFASGQIATFKMGTGGLEVKSAVQSAAARPIKPDIKSVTYDKLNMARKDDLDNLHEIKMAHPRALCFVVRKKGATKYYEDYALEEYVFQLAGLPDFKYFLFFGPEPALPFLGGIAAGAFCQALRPTPLIVGREAPPQKRITLRDLTDILNGDKDFDPISSLEGFVGKDKALRKKDDTRTALARMDEAKINWLPVLERSKLEGVVEQSSLTASLLLDVTNALTGSRSRRSRIG